MAGRAFGRVLFSLVVGVSVLLVVPTGVALAEEVDVSTTWNGSFIDTVGATLSDYYAQSFITKSTVITKFGVVIGETAPEGQVLLALAADNGSGRPNLAAPLYQGTLINPTPTFSWYYEEGLNIPVTPGNRYWVVIDGYNNAGATGNSGVGSSSTYTSSGENMLYSNDHGTSWGQVGNAIALYVAGKSAPVPALSAWMLGLLAALVAGVALSKLKG